MWQLGKCLASAAKCRTDRRRLGGLALCYRLSGGNRGEHPQASEFEPSVEGGKGTSPGRFWTSKRNCLLEGPVSMLGAKDEPPPVNVQLASLTKSGCASRASGKPDATYSSPVCFPFG